MAVIAVGDFQKPAVEALLKSHFATLPAARAPKPRPTYPVPDQPGTLYDGFAIDYGCYVALMLDSKLPTRPRQRVGWLNSTHAVPPDGFDFRAEAIDLDALK